MSVFADQDAIAARVEQEAEGVWFACVDVNGREFWSGGPYASEAEAQAHARQRMQFFVMLLSAPDEP